MRSFAALTVAAFFALTACQAKEGGFCLQEGKSTCSADGTEFGTCVKHKWQFEPCRGPNGCRTQGSNIKCDESVGKVGDKCDGEDTGTCTADKKKYLTCEQHAFAEHSQCKGPKGCYVKSVKSTATCPLRHR